MRWRDPVAAADRDALWMDRALRVAERGIGLTSPNPAVGAVLVKDERVVGEGAHLRAGGPHAEIVALDAAGPAASGATCYVTLEPCAHFGRTAPCADALVQAGIARVVAAVEDPHRVVDGRGIARLRAAGVAVTVGVREAEARRLNRGFFSVMTEGRPHVTLKTAMTLDGKIAAVDGVSRWITGEAARLEAHRLRFVADAILVGIGTVLADDPQLTVRHPATPAEGAAPRRRRQPVAHSRRRARPACGRSGARRGSPASRRPARTGQRPCAPGACTCSSCRATPDAWTCARSSTRSAR